MKVCPFNDERECPLPHRERSDKVCVACQLAELARGLKEWHESKGQRFNLVWVYPPNMPSIAELVDADKTIANKLHADSCITNSKTVVVDLDGVLVDFRGCKQGCNYLKYPDVLPDRGHCPEMPGAARSLYKLKEMGYVIVIHTSRAKEEREATERWLSVHKMAYDQLVMEKPRGWLYIDDFGLKFINWKETMRFVNGGKA